MIDIFKLYLHEYSNGSVKNILYPDFNAIETVMVPYEIPKFTKEILNGIIGIRQAILDNFGKIIVNTQEYEVKTVIMSSSHSDVFNLGGDLGEFARILEIDDMVMRKSELTNYADLCLESILVSRNLTDTYEIQNIAMVDGQISMGGGTEAFMGADITIASSSSEFSLPETYFGGYPGMGGRRIFRYFDFNKDFRDEMVKLGIIYGAKKLKDNGIVDYLVEDNCARNMLMELLNSKINGSNIQLINNEYDVDKLKNSVAEWVDIMCNLNKQNIRKIKLLNTLQKRKYL
jgi:enoyl-CoA hydratase/carnithine racemase